MHDVILKKKKKLYRLPSLSQNNGMTGLDVRSFDIN
jgi:hypothetical protein